MRYDNINFEGIKKELGALALELGLGLDEKEY